ncbi:CDP-diacylglycerol--serine O-phosphatidyltransferase [Limisalsivibrio acetivorans]|uniref:CDP-diacylglycerol--serine O-phosphatidyltransferase n=1 Tax=Limisalsivibrio acetivorans TaxID=1304888 RepID=UPI0003B3C624|nr:CDP-diacylglycerol--serine O-phosphatidyltransferase [Limisalsivibrio acetivorans]
MMKKTLVFPNIITLLGLFSGFYSIVATLNGEYVIAAYATLLAFLFDGMDGKVARILNASSDFGIQLDSLADLVSFGVAPALLVYQWALKPYGRLGWMAAFLFIACAALRLARFNVQTKRLSSKFFIGLPSPAAAGVIVTSVLFANHIFGDPSSIEVPLWFTFMIYIVGFLMVSNIPYYSFKNIEGISSKPFNTLVGVVLIIFVLGLYPEVFLFLLSLGYALSGLIYVLFRKNRLHLEEEAQNI